MNEAENYPIQKLCATIHIARSSYYKWLKRTPSHNQQVNEQLAEWIKQHYEERNGILLCIRSYSSSVQRIVIVRLRFLIVSRSFLCAIFERGFGGRPDQQAFGGLPNAMLAFHTSVACTAPSAVVFFLCQCRHTRSTLRDNRFCGHRWDNYPISVSEAKTGVFVRVFTAIRERYTVTLNHKCRHPQFYRHPSQTKVNRRFLNFGCRYGQ